MEEVCRAICREEGIPETYWPYYVNTLEAAIRVLNYYWTEFDTSLRAQVLSMTADGWTWIMLIGAIANAAIFFYLVGTIFGGE